MSLKETIANWYFSTHKIEDKLGHNPYLETGSLGRIRNTLGGFYFRKGVISAVLAGCFNAAAGYTESNLELALGAAGLGVMLDLHTRWRESEETPDYYIDTKPEYIPRLPQDSALIGYLTRQYYNNDPVRTASYVSGLTLLISGFAMSAGQPNGIPYAVAGAVVYFSCECRKYWQARQILNENWQLYTSLPKQETQSQPDSKRNARAAPAPTV